MPWSLFPILELMDGLEPLRAAQVHKLWLDAVFMETTLLGAAGEGDEESAAVLETFGAVRRAA